MRPLVSPVLFALIIAGCASEDPAAFEPDPGREPTHTTTFRYVDYPEAPYGTVVGSVISDLEFLGWEAPQHADYDRGALHALSLSRFYDRQGDDLEFIFVNTAAVWCGACRVEYEEFERLGVYEAFRERGVEFVGVLFEDNDANPARIEDLENWAEAYSVAFPMVLDPAFKLSPYFDREATPMNMIIDARTMRIVLLDTGYDPALFGTLDQKLEERGR